MLVKIDAWQMIQGMNSFLTFACRPNVHVFIYLVIISVDSQLENSTLNETSKQTNYIYYEEPPELPKSYIDQTKALTPQQKYNIFHHGKLNY